MPRGAEGTPRLTEGQVRTPEETIELAQQLLDDGRPFHAHEVFEDAWKAATDEFQLLWKGLAQLAVGLTHLGRGNAAGATSLLRRAADTLGDFRGAAPYGLRVGELADWAVALAEHTERDGLPADPIATPKLR